MTHGLDFRISLPTVVSTIAPFSTDISASSVSPTCSSTGFGMMIPRELPTGLIVAFMGLV
jgi:hypothetical protein